MPLVAETLVAIGETARARLLVRDTLLAGGEISDIAEDQPVADLLSEDLEPQWLASLGAIRRLVLRLAECRAALPQPVLHAARRRLKCLHPDLHAAYMNRAGPFA